DDGAVLQRLEAVAGLGYHDEIARPPVPLVLSGAQPHASAQHDQRRLTGILVFGQGGSGGQRDDRLSKDVFVASVDGARAPTRVGLAARSKWFLASASNENFCIVP